MIVPTLLRRMRSVTGFFVLLLLVSLASPVGASGSVGTGAIQNGGNGVADGSLVFVQNTGQFDP